MELVVDMSDLYIVFGEEFLFLEEIQKRIGQNELANLHRYCFWVYNQALAAIISVIDEFKMLPITDTHTPN